MRFWYLIVAGTLMLVVALGGIGLANPALFKGLSDDGDQTTPQTQTATVSPTPSVTATTLPTGDLPGWKLVYAQDFNRQAVVGQFDKVYSTKLMGYNGFFDHANRGTGLYAPLRVLSTHDGLLDYHLHTENGNPLIAAVTPTGYTGQKYGRYVIRFRADLAPGYRLACLLWPDGTRETRALWEKGEIDFPEVNLIDRADPATGLTPSINGFSHDTTGHPSINRLQFVTNASAQTWHTAIIEWTPTRVTFSLDGQKSATTTDPAGIPTSKMHWVLQAQTSSTKRVKPDADVSGHVYIDWLAQYAYDPKSN